MILKMKTVHEMPMPIQPAWIILVGRLLLTKVAYLMAVLEVEEDDVIDVFGDEACNRARSEELL